jgi:myo-inositol-1-phosphate synthase
MANKKLKKASGRLAILLPGLGAVSTTFIAGVDLIRRRGGLPVGSMTQLGTARLGKRTDNRVVPIKDLVPLASLDDLAFGAWDIVDEDGREVAERSRVLTPEHLAGARSLLEGIKPKKGVHDPDYVRRIEANHVKGERKAREKVEALRQDIRDFKRELKADRAVMVFTASTEVHHEPTEATSSLKALEKALDKDDRTVSPTMLYAYAAIQEGVPFANGTPNYSVDLPALQDLAREHQVPIAGKDFKTGQTMMKTVLGPALKARMLGLNGWFSTNILGNRDGEVLDDPQAFRSKEVTKTGVLESILERNLYPQLYGEYSHKVSIHYYPPRGDEKEGWDNIDLFGWLNYKMQIKVNFLCRDSILAAPLVLDLALFMDLAKRLGWRGIQEWLSFYFKCPMAKPGLEAENDLFIQQTKLKNTLRVVGGEEPIDHLGLDYYGDDLPLAK